jgi:hypothetical protein
MSGSCPSLKASAFPFLRRACLGSLQMPLDLLFRPWGCVFQPLVRLSKPLNRLP